MAIEVTPQDVSDAEDFLVEFVSDNIPDGDYSDGSLLRDMAIKSVAFVVAYLKKTDAQIRVRQSLKSIEEVDTSDDAEAADDAADAIISNWYASRNQGQFARVVAYGFSVERIDITVGADIVFYKTAGLPFILDNAGAALHIPAESLIAQFDSSGEITSYTFRIPLVSQNTGAAFNVAPGRFASFDEFSPYVTYVETLEKAAQGGDVESTDALIDRSRTLVTVRNLINARSCDAVLRDEFENIRSLTVIGMGDTEMVRDRVSDAATGLTLHTGGHQDIFVDVPFTETSFSGVVGAKFTRPDGVISVFRDTAYADYDATSNPGGRKFTDTDPTTLLPLQAGMALRIWSGLTQGARDYVIREVRDTELYVSEKVPFPAATDVDGTFVTWSVGQNMPNYQDVVPQTATGETSAQVQSTGRITLPGGPVYHIHDISIDEAGDPDADPADNLVHLNVRSNVEPTAQVAPDNEYQVIVHNAEDHQSMRSYVEISVGPAGDLAKYDGKTVKVTYDTLAGFSAVDTKVSNRRDRIASENPLTRGYHPAYLSFGLEYRLLRSATESIDADEAIDELIGYINTFPPTEVVDVSLISDFFRAVYPHVGHVFPFLISYTVHVPDGRVVEFETTEAVTVPSSLSELQGLLSDPTDSPYGLLNPLDYGLSDDVIRYLALKDTITVTERG